MAVGHRKNLGGAAVDGLRTAGLVLGLLADLPRNYWTIAGHASDASPDGMQHLLNRANRFGDRQLNRS